MITHASTLKNPKIMDEDTEKETLSYPVGGNANEKVSFGSQFGKTYTMKNARILTQQFCF